MDKIEILLRFVEDWFEVYINDGISNHTGKLVSEGDIDEYGDIEVLYLDLADWWAGIEDGHVAEIRRIVIKSDDSDNLPVFAFTGEKYWSDWDNAEVIFNNDFEDFPMHMDDMLGGGNDPEDI